VNGLESEKMAACFCFHGYKKKILLVNFEHTQRFSQATHDVKLTTFSYQCATMYVFSTKTTRYTFNFQNKTRKFFQPQKHVRFVILRNLSFDALKARAKSDKKALFVKSFSFSFSNQHENHRNHSNQNSLKSEKFNEKNDNRYLVRF